MGDIADMMLEGVLCQGCGVYLGDGDGFPIFCSGCAKQDKSQKLNPLKAPCKYCGKRYKKSGLHAHTLAKHPEVKQAGERYE